MTLLIADRLPDDAVERFGELELPVRFEPDLGADDLPAQLGQTQVLIVRSTRVTAAAIAGAPLLSLIVRAGAGVNTIDIEAASAAAVTVANCPGRNAVAVAELAFGLMLAVDRRIPQATALLRQGRWEKKSLADAQGLYGRALGVVGTGQIGRAVIHRAHAFGLKVIAWSRSLTDESAAELGVTRCPTLLDLAGRADIVSLHLAAAPETRQIIGAEFFGAMRRGATFINCARGNLVDQAALVRAMDERDIRAGLDVFDPEPGGGSAPFDDPIASHPNLVATHHLGASTHQATMATALEALRVVRTFLETGDAPNAVNIRDMPSDETGIVVRHEDRVGVLAGVLDVLKHADLNVEEMANRIFDSGAAASAKIMLNRPAGTHIVERIGACEGVIHVSEIGATDGV